MSEEHPREGDEVAMTPFASVSPAVDRSARRLLVVMPRDRVSEYDSVVRTFADVPDCRVIVDRRILERRGERPLQPGHERRRDSDRRSGCLETQETLVLHVH